MNKEYSEFTLYNWKKWDLVRYIKKQDECINKISDQIEKMYLSEKISYKSKIELLKALNRIIPKEN